MHCGRMIYQNQITLLMQSTNFSFSTNIITVYPLSNIGYFQKEKGPKCCMILPLQEIQTTCAEFCSLCEKKVYPLEKVETGGKLLHKQCFRCLQCNCILRYELLWSSFKGTGRRIISQVLCFRKVSVENNRTVTYEVMQLSACVHCYRLKRTRTPVMVLFTLIVNLQFCVFQTNF